jgi:hypothetical protein
VDPETAQISSSIRQSSRWPTGSGVRTRWISSRLASTGRCTGMSVESRTRTASQPTIFGSQSARRTLGASLPKH